MPDERGAAILAFGRDRHPRGRIGRDPPPRCRIRGIRRNPVRSNVFKGAMATDSRPISAAAKPPRRAWRRAANVAATVALVVASVAAQAADLTPIAIVLLVAAVCALAPLFSPAIDA
jgi:hypothetical protein